MPPATACASSVASSSPGTRRPATPMVLSFPGSLLCGVRGARRHCHPFCAPAPIARGPTGQLKPNTTNSDPLLQRLVDHGSRLLAVAAPPEVVALAMNPYL